jgi:RimJ/RimL family protein N-acetyltransferase
MIRLEKFDESDFERLINWIDSEESMIQFSGPIFNYPITHEQLDKYIAVDNRLVYKVINTDSGEIVGHAELNNIDNKNKSARICRILIGEKPNRNKGFGKAIIKALIQIGFCDLQLHRLDLGVFDFNQQAIKCYKDCGFEIEGLLKDTTKMGSEYWSIYNMSIINKDK